MSDYKLKDGTGFGYMQEVTANNRAAITGDTENRQSFLSKKSGVAYAIGSGIKTVTSSITDPIIWFENTDPARSFIVQKININWSGGSGLSTAQVVFKQGAGAATANTTLKTASPLNTNFSQVAPATIYQWDGVGTGITVASGGDVGGAVIVGPGHTPIEFDGAVVYAPGAVRTASVTVTESGNFFVAYLGYFEDLG